MLKRITMICLVVAVGSLVAYGNPTPYTGTETGLIALYHLDEASANIGDTVADASPNGNDMTVSVANYGKVSGLFGNAVTGVSNGRIQIAGASAGDFKVPEVTIETWVSFTQDQLNNLVGTMPMVNRGYGTAYANFTYSLIMYDSGTAGEPLVRIMWADTTGSGSYTEKKYAFTADTWYHIGTTVTLNSGSNYTGRIWITEAGVETAVYQTGATASLNYTMNQSTRPVNLFQIDSNIDTDYFPGTMDEVAIFDYAKDASEFTTLVPEPTTLCLVGLGGFISLLRRRRR